MCMDHLSDALPDSGMPGFAALLDDLVDCGLAGLSACCLAGALKQPGFGRLRGRSCQRCAPSLRTQDVCAYFRVKAPKGCGASGEAYAGATRPCRRVRLVRWRPSVRLRPTRGLTEPGSLPAPTRAGRRWATCHVTPLVRHGRGRFRWDVGWRSVQGLGEPFRRAPLRRVRGRLAGAPCAEAMRD